MPAVASVLAPSSSFMRFDSSSGGGGAAAAGADDDGALNNSQTSGGALRGFNSSFGGGNSSGGGGGARESERVMTIVGKFWAMDQRTETDVCDLRQYAQLNLRLYKALVSPFDLVACYEAVLGDWRRDVGTRCFLTWRAFAESLLAVADRFVIDHDEWHYIRFLETLFRCVTYRSRSVGVLCWRPLESIAPLSDGDVAACTLDPGDLDLAQLFGAGADEILPRPHSGSASPRSPRRGVPPPQARPTRVRRPQSAASIRRQLHAPAPDELDAGAMLVNALRVEMLRFHYSARDVFDVLDADRDGRLTQNDVARAVRAFGIASDERAMDRGRLSADDIGLTTELLYRSLDASRTYGLTFPDFQSALRMTPGTSGTARVRHVPPAVLDNVVVALGSCGPLAVVFRALDPRGRGWVSRAHFVVGLRTIQLGWPLGVPSEVSCAVFDCLDANSDGRLHQADLLRGIEEILSRRSHLAAMRQPKIQLGAGSGAPPAPAVSGSPAPDDAALGIVHLDDDDTSTGGDDGEAV